VFCPHQGNPYKDKTTIFWTVEDFIDSTNTGFLRIDRENFKVRNEAKEIINYKLGDNTISEELKVMIETVINDYSYLI
jgi:putative selenate reductase